MDEECESRVIAVVDPARVRTEADDPHAFVDVVVAWGVPARELAPTVRAARTMIAATAPSQRPPAHLKLVAPGPEPDCARVLLGRAPLANLPPLPPALHGAALRCVRAPARAPLSRAQAECWAAAAPDLWPAQYRPLAPDERPPPPLPVPTVRAAEAHMRIALIHARAARDRGDVCFAMCSHVMFCNSHFVAMVV